MKAKFSLLGLCMVMFSGCGLLHPDNAKSGCPTTNNIGAERIMSGDPVALRAAKKANKKYKQTKTFYN